MPTAGSDPELRAFHARWARWMCVPLAIAIGGSFTALAIWLTVIDWEPWHAWDMIWMIGIGAVIAFLLLRVGLVAAIPDHRGLLVRNVLPARRLDWAEIIGVSFNIPAGDPWAILDLTDGSSCPVLSLQAADGVHAQDEVERLRRLIRRYGEPIG